MASCITKIWSGTTAPQVKLTVSLDTATSDGDTAVLDWSLDYVAHGYAANASSARDYTVKINGAVPTNGSGSFNINGITGTKNIKSGSVSIAKGTAAKNISFSVSFAFNLTWSGVYAGTLSASSSISIPAKTSYAIKYNANGGSGAPASQTKWYGTALTLSGTKPTRTGYAFSKWNTAANGGGTSYNAGASYTANAAATLYAQWTANTYTIKYDANGGSGAPANQTKTYGVTLKLQTGKPTRTNYEFLGWSTSKTATTATYKAGADFTTNANTTLYAVWKLAYTKPKISNLSATRCDSDGTISDDGNYAELKFDWSCTQSVSSIVVNWSPATGGVSSATITASGTSGVVDQVIGNGQFDSETSYDFTVTIADGGGSTDRNTPMSGVEFHIDFGPDTVSIGKPAEPFYNIKGNKQKAFDVNWLARMRNHVCVGDKIGHLDGKTGILLSYEGYMHLQRTTAQGYHPYIGFLLDNDEEVTAQIRHNCQTKALELLGAASYKVDATLYSKQVRSSAAYQAFIQEHPTSGKSVAFGFGGDGTTCGIWDITNQRWPFMYNGNDVYLTPACGQIKPYFTAGDSYTHIIRTAGYVTNSKTEVHFTVPISKPIVGSTAVSAASINGFIMRQGDKYTHGSAASTYAKPTSYSCAICGNGTHLAVIATFSDTTNAINNDAIGIYANFTLTFS